MSRAGVNGTLSEKIARLHQAGEEYRAALNQYTDRLIRLGLECDDISKRSQAALKQHLLNRREEEAVLVKHAEAQLKCLRPLEYAETLAPSQPLPTTSQPLPTTFQARAPPQPHPDARVTFTNLGCIGGTSDWPAPPFKKPTTPYAT